MTARGVGMKRQAFMIVGLFAFCSVGNGVDPQRIPLDKFRVYDVPPPRGIEELNKDRLNRAVPGKPGCDIAAMCRNRKLVPTRELTIALLMFIPDIPDTPIEQKKTQSRIPLDQIWAWRMPGTNDIGKLEPDKPANYAYGPLVAEIRRSLATRPQNEEKAKLGFAVLGTGLQALREASAVFTKKSRPRKTFPVNSEVSVVFFSYQFGPYVHVHDVARQGNIVDIRYKFVPHEEEISAEGIALIPLGKLGAGKYRVNIVQNPMEQKYLDLGFRPVSETNARRIVCRSFSFAVSEQGE